MGIKSVRWDLTITDVDNKYMIDLREVDADHIAQCIKDGFTSGEIVIND